MRNSMRPHSLVMALFGFVASAACGQDGYSPPMLEFGVPDLQGTWSYETRTGLQRREGYVCQRRHGTARARHAHSTRLGPAGQLVRRRIALARLRVDVIGARGVTVAQGRPRRRICAELAR